MSSAVPLFRSLIIYGVCLPVAIFVGYQLAEPNDLSSLVVIGLLIMVMTIPLFLRWHYPMLVISYNMIAGFYFLPGKPSLFLVLSFVSLGISCLSYIMNRNLKFIPVPTMTKPILFLSAVVLVTAKLTGGIGFGMTGGNSVGGKHYIQLASAFVGFFALTAQRIPFEKIGLYVNLYFLSALTSIIGNLVVFINPAFYFIYYIFPADLGGMSLNPYGESIADGGTILRLGGLGGASVFLGYALLAKFGLQGLFEPGKKWRLVVFVTVMTLSLFGGFRSSAINVALLCFLMFWLEGLVHSRLMPTFLLGAVLLGAVVVPFSNKLPLSIQRSLAFIPPEMLNLNMDARLNAEASLDWRLQMWQDVIPTIPKYLLLGKGYAIDAHDLEMTSEGLTAGEHSSYGSMIAGDYHNGPLSVIIPFGIFGVIGFLWVLWAGFKVLRNNYHYGDPAVQNINRFFLAFYVCKALMFFGIFGSLFSNLPEFLGIVGFSVALNGGVRVPVPVPANPHVFKRFKLVPATQ